jgi:hypothetical protein
MVVLVALGSLVWTANALAGSAPLEVVTGGPLPSCPPINPESPELCGTITLSGGGQVRYYFELGTSLPYSQKIPANGTEVSISASEPTVVVTAKRSGLEPNTTYHYRLAATDGEGSLFGSDATFTTLPSPPLIESEPATGISEHDATLNAKINPNGAYTAYEFQIDTNASYNFPRPACPLEVPWYAVCEDLITGEPLPAGLHEPSQGSIPAGSSGQSVSLDLGSILDQLAPRTTYHYRVIASNDGQIVEGPDQTFTTPGATAPVSIDSVWATGITEHDATLNASINPNGGETVYFFQIYPDGSYDFTQPNCPLGTCASITVGAPLPPGLIEAPYEFLSPLSGDQTVSLDMADIGAILQSGTTYHFRVTASNSPFSGKEGGVKRSPDQTFTTAGNGPDNEPNSGPVAQVPATMVPDSALVTHHKRLKRRHHRRKAHRAKHSG